MKRHTTHLKSLCFLMLSIISSSYCELIFAEAPASCIEDDYIGLRALYLSTNGDNWIVNDEWMSASDFIDNTTLPSTQDMSLWHGITVNQNGCVSKIELFTNDLSGSIPSDLKNMVGLEILDLGHNQIGGIIPQELGNLAELKELHLQSNQLVGSVPNTLGGLNSLERLNLTSNQLTGSIPSELGNLAGLKYLFLKYNNLTGIIPSSLGSLSNLIILSIHDNGFSGSIPSSLGDLDLLENLMLDDNQLTGEIPNTLGNMESLVRLRLSGNYLTGTIPASIGDLTELTIFTFQDNELSGCFDENLHALCSQMTTSQNSYTSEGNNFCVPWEDFCDSLTGVCGSTDGDEYCYCQTTLNLHENPEPDFINRASFDIKSDDLIDHNLFSSYTAGNHIDLEEGFEVKLGSDFEADIDICTEGCEVSEPCSGPPCAPLDIEYDSDGNPYFSNQLAIVFPSLTPQAGSNQEDVKTYLDPIIFDFVENPPPNFDLSTFKESTTISQCLCGFNLFLYEVDDIYEINEEGGGLAASSSGGPMEEGPSYVVNHLVDTGMTNEEAPIVGNIPPPLEDQYLNDETNIQNPVVAFLDSGIDPAYIPSGALLADKQARPNFIINEHLDCNSTPVDRFGWNFVDDDTNIVDDRGHGTSVYLAYQHALGKLGIEIEQQNTLIVKVLDGCGIGSAYSTACGISYAYAREADIISASWGLYANNTLLQTSIDHVVANGMLVSTSAGNQGKDLSLIEHFPSAYGYTYDRIVDFATNELELSEGYDQIFEVGGLCRNAANETCVGANDNVDLWSGSNYRSNGPMFSEPGIEIQDLYTNMTVGCGIMGTSYAAPQFTAGLVDMHIQNSGNDGVTQNEVINNSMSWDVDEVGIYYSYLLSNQSCN